MFLLIYYYYGFPLFGGLMLVSIAAAISPRYQGLVWVAGNVALFLIYLRTVEAGTASWLACLIVGGTWAVFYPVAALVRLSWVSGESDDGTKWPLLPLSLLGIALWAAAPIVGPGLVGH